MNVKYSKLMFEFMSDLVELRWKSKNFSIRAVLVSLRVDEVKYV